MSTEVAVVEPREVVITTEQTDLIKRTICHGATDAEMQLFFFDCQRRGTHPLDKLIHFTKRDGKYTPVTSIDFFRLRAHSSQVFDGEDEAVFEIGNDGFPDTCKYVVYRIVNGQRRPWHATARWDEYYPGEKSGFMWRKMPYLMLAKCAEALALRKAFPAELQGLYVKEEMDQEGPEQKPLRKGAEMLADIEKRDAPPSELETQLRASLAAQAEKGQHDGAQPATEEFALPRPAKSDDAAPLDDPAEMYRAKIKVAHDEKECSAAYAATPETLKQDVHGDYFAKLKELSKRKGTK